MKVVELDDKRERDACLYCGKEPACPGMTCPKVARFELWEDGSIAAVEFFDPAAWKPRA